MKKLLGVSLAFLIIFSLAACSWGGDDIDNHANTIKDINEGLDEFEFDEVDENVNLNTNQPELTEDETIAAQARDEERVEKVAQIETALELYLADNGSYPETSDELVSDYLNAWPLDPGEFEYVYTPIGALPAKFKEVIIWNKALSEIEIRTLYQRR